MVEFCKLTSKLVSFCYPLLGILTSSLTWDTFGRERRGMVHWIASGALGQVCWNTFPCWCIFISFLGSLTSGQLFRGLSRLPLGKAYHFLALFCHLLWSAGDTEGLFFLKGRSPFPGPPRGILFVSFSLQRSVCWTTSSCHSNKLCHKIESLFCRNRIYKW